MDSEMVHEPLIPVELAQTSTFAICQRQPDILIGDEEGFVGSRAWMRQSIAHWNVGPLSLV